MVSHYSTDKEFVNALVATPPYVNKGIYTGQIHIGRFTFIIYKRHFEVMYCEDTVIIVSRYSNGGTLGITQSLRLLNTEVGLIIPMRVEVVCKILKKRFGGDWL